MATSKKMEICGLDFLKVNNNCRKNSDQYMRDMNIKISRDQNLSSAKMDGDTVMMSEEKGMYYGLNPMAGKIWDMLQNPISPDEIIARLLDEFEVEKNTCEKEVIKFLDKLDNNDLLVIH